MLETPQIVQSPEQPAAVLHVRVPRARIREVMGPGLQEVLGAVKAQGLTPTGPWFAHHLLMDPETFDFELGVPVASPIRETGRVRPGGLPAATVARTLYRGDYSGLFSAWGEFLGWMKANGWAPGPDLWEVYAVGPETSADPADWRTELNRPVMKA